jgi:hypothetical protein
MNRRLTPPLLTLALPFMLAASLIVAALPSRAAPGAHGPDGEHLDQPGAAQGASSSSLPRLEAKSDVFELVAELRAKEFVIVVDRYDTNEPVLGAKLEVESGAAKAVAAFRAEQGDYVVADAALLKTLGTPGEHGLVFTLVAGKDSDLLDGTLNMRAASPQAHGHSHGLFGLGLRRLALIGAAVTALVLLGMGAWWLLRRRRAVALQGVQR